MGARAARRADSATFLLASQGATVRFYAVFGGLVLFTCLVCFMKNHCGKDGDDAPKSDQANEEP